MSPYQIELLKKQHESVSQDIESSFGMSNIPLKGSSIQRNPNYSHVLNNIFLEPQAESKLGKARMILGEIAQELSDDELIGCLAQFQNMLDSWFSEFEKQIFEGKTLDQIIRGGQNGGNRF